jgi:hypothetical protein
MFDYAVLGHVLMVLYMLLMVNWFVKNLRHSLDASLYPLVFIVLTTNLWYPTLQTIWAWTTSHLHLIVLYGAISLIVRAFATRAVKPKEKPKLFPGYDLPLHKQPQILGINPRKN